MDKNKICEMLEFILEAGTLSTQSADKLCELIDFIRSEN